MRDTLTLVFAIILAFFLIIPMMVYLLIIRIFDKESYDKLNDFNDLMGYEEDWL